MDVVVLGVSHHSAPIGLREKFDFSKHPSETYLSRLASCESIRSGMVLSTCNRVEVYAAGLREQDLVNDIERFLAMFHEEKDSVVRPYLYRRMNRDAVRHLFRVAASLDSLVVGEPQILGQVKEAYFDAREFSLTDPFFEKLLQRAFHVAKKVRSGTQIAEHAVSVSYAAVELAKKIFGAFEKKQVMVFGGGEMAELAARDLKGYGAEGVFFVNRSYDQSVELSKECGGIPVPMKDWEGLFPKVDIAIVSTAAPNYLITADQVRRTMEVRKQSPTFLIDISVPRNVDPAVNELENVYLYNIDDLENIVSENRMAREKEAEKAEAIVEVEVGRFYEAVGKLAIAPVIQRLQGKYEQLRKDEVERLRKRLSTLSLEQQQEVERAMESLMKKTLNDPILFVNRQHSNKEMLDQLATFMDIFGLRDEEPKK